MENSKPYRDFGDFLREVFPYKVQKISINAGFTCPNRDGTKGFGGCTYCNNQTFSPEYCHTEKSVTEQLEAGVRFFSRKYPEMKYLAYFQAYTNTYDKLDSLISKYEEALACPDVVGLIVGTRPDCMPDALLDISPLYPKEVRDDRIWPGEHAGPHLNPYQPGTYTCRIRRDHPSHGGQKHLHGSPLDLRPSGRKQRRDIAPCRHPVRPSSHDAEAPSIAAYPRYAHGQGTGGTFLNSSISTPPMNTSTWS